MLTTLDQPQLCLARPSSGGSSERIVEVEVTGASGGSTLQSLGSLTERYGMAMYRHRTRSDRVSILVPRARSQGEAEEVVGSLLDRVGHWADSAIAA